MVHVVGVILGVILFWRFTQDYKFNWVDYCLFVIAVTLLFV